MDLFVLDKMIESRKKSVDSLRFAIGVLEKDAGETTNPVLRKLYESQKKVRAQRLSVIVGELAALEAERARLQPELPGVGAKSRPGAK